MRSFQGPPGLKGSSGPAGPTGALVRLFFHHLLSDRLLFDPDTIIAVMGTLFAKFTLDVRGHVIIK